MPINDTEFMLDLICHLDMPVIVASRTALGTINHTRLTVHALRDFGAIRNDWRGDDRRRKTATMSAPSSASPTCPSSAASRLETINRDALLRSLSLAISIAGISSNAQAIRFPSGIRSRRRRSIPPPIRVERGAGRLPLHRRRPASASTPSPPGG